MYFDGHNSQGSLFILWCNSEIVFDIRLLIYLNGKWVCSLYWIYDCVIYYLLSDLYLFLVRYYVRIEIITFLRTSFWFHVFIAIRPSTPIQKFNLRLHVKCVGTELRFWSHVIKILGWWLLHLNIKLRMKIWELWLCNSVKVL